MSRGALGMGVVCLALCAIGWSSSPQSFFSAWLFAELVWLGVALGCMAFLMIHYLTGGKWGWPVRRFFEAAAAPPPLLTLLFLAPLFRLRLFFPWATSAPVAAGQGLQH